jgi:hypothetical protein
MVDDMFTGTTLLFGGAPRTFSVSGPRLRSVYDHIWHPTLLIHLLKLPTIGRLAGGGAFFMCGLSG